MIVTFTKSFERSLRKCGEKDRAKEAVRQLLAALQTNKKPEGLGLKKLRDDIWEIRGGLRTRVLFAMLPGEIRLLLTGKHEEIHRFLRK